LRLCKGNIFYIYVITNKITGKNYVGQTKNPKKRWYNHKRANNSIISQSIKKHGVDNFYFNVIEEFETNQEVAEAEIFWIKYLDTLVPNGYNGNKGGAPLPEKLEELKKSISIKWREQFKTGVRTRPPRGKNPFPYRSAEDRSKPQVKKLTQEQVAEIRNLFLSRKRSISMLVNEYTVSSVTIASILKNISYKDSNYVPPLFIPNKGIKAILDEKGIVYYGINGIVEELGFTKQEVTKELRQPNGKFKWAPKTIKLNGKIQITPEQAILIRKKYDENLISASEIADQFKVSRYTVMSIGLRKTWKNAERIIEKRALKVKRSPKKLKPDFGPELILELRRLYNSGWYSDRKLASLFNLDYGCVHRCVINEIYVDPTYYPRDSNSLGSIVSDNFGNIFKSVRIASVFHKISESSVGRSIKEKCAVKGVIFIYSDPPLELVPNLTLKHCTFEKTKIRSSHSS